ncbi:hypothetical protein CEXT_169261 [Caerostris extrusa]|uniref:Uncharacterized protein n=1 Tax=Caerostris extrusa TaxID=172846 RepID=A0AAV4QHC9_CAEEX|nr:hypothetical protein CEXT_169261 [Caerostris extrusa]
MQDDLKRATRRVTNQNGDNTDKGCSLRTPIWSATTDVFDFSSDINKKILADGLAKAKWNQYSPPIEKNV